MKKGSKNILLFIILGFCTWSATGQELNAQVTVTHKKIRGEDASTFDKMEKAITQFLNNRHWTATNYKTNERIDCRFLIDLQQELDGQVYKAFITVQSSRPVYSTTYKSTLLNYKDQDVVFRFEPFQPLVFNENRISGNDPQASNLTALLAYYAYLIIGLDQDSFAPNGGHDAFEMAEKIVANAPRGRSITGWNAFDGTFNRYWMMENLLNVRYQQIHEVYYTYHRKGLDLMYDHSDQGRQAIIECLNKLNALNANNPNLMILKVFFTAKADELADIFSEGPPQERMTALNLLQKMDPSNSSSYRKSIRP